MANEDPYYIGSGTDYYYQFDSGSSGNYSYWVGYSNSFSTKLSGAVRFVNVDLAKNANIDNATLRLRVGYRAGSSTVKVKVEGFDEDNTATFSSGPGSRPKTSAYTTGEYSPTSTGWNDYDVTAIVEEIVARSGWSSGNAIGFWLTDDGTSTSADNYIDDSTSSSENCILLVRLEAEPDFTPTPVVLSSPALPSIDSFGIEVSEPGIDVKNATEEQLYMTTRKDMFKVHIEGYGTGSATIPHNLGYVPNAIVYMRDQDNNNNFIMLPLFSSFDAAGAFYVDDTNLVITVRTNDVYYYYVFYDQLAI